MKNKGIFISILNQGWVRPELADLLAKLSDQKKYNLFITYPAKKPITNNRNSIVKRFLETDYDYLLMIDADCPPPEDILDMADYDKDVIGAVCFGYMGKRLIPFVMKKRTDGKYDMIDVSIDDGVVECDAVGSGVMMIARRVLENMPFPFKNEYDPEGIKVKGLDFNFCKRAQKLGYKIWVDSDKLCSHWSILDMKTIWMTFNSIRKQVIYAQEQLSKNQKANTEGVSRD